MSEYVVRIGGREYRAEVKELTPEHATVGVDGKDYRVDLVQLGRHATPASPAAAPRATTPAAVPVAAAPPVQRAAAATGNGAITAPMPGLVRVLVKLGDEVAKDQPLLVMEAMKMENAVTAPFTGTVSRVFVREGDSIGEGDRLVEVARPKLTAL
jgi:biotin carboxyl carrier protein